MTRFRLYILIIFCVFSILFSIIMFFLPDYLFAAPGATAFQLKDYNGRIALFIPENESPIKVYELYTRLLPESDILALQKGVPAADEAELERLLEDYGL